MTNEDISVFKQEVLDEIADLEEYANRGEQPPLCKGYRIRVNRKTLVIDTPFPTGEEILTKAEYIPAKDYTLRMVISGSRPEKIALDQKVDLTKKGIERFKVLPRDQTEG